MPGIKGDCYVTAPREVIAEKPPHLFMKTKLTTLAFAIIAAVSVQAQAQESTTTTTKVTAADGSSKTTTSTTTSYGTITDYAPGATFIVKETSGPVTYRYGDKITYVTRSGRVLTDDDVKLRVKIGAPVHVHYTSHGDSRVISRVEVDD